MATDSWPITIQNIHNNNPKHTSKDAATCKYLDDNRIYWWRTLAESPDLNPIPGPLAQDEGVQ